MRRFGNLQNVRLGAEDLEEPASIAAGQLAAARCTERCAKPRRAEPPEGCKAAVAGFRSPDADLTPLLLGAK
jgi:hypothetical protein